MTQKMESPGALAGATGANMKAASFTPKQYPAGAPASMPFKHVRAAALRVLHLTARHGMTAERAAMVAPVIFGEGRA